MSLRRLSLQNIEAGKPYLVGWPAEVQLEDITNPVFHGVTISTTLNPVETTPADAPEGTEVTFAGAYSPMMIGLESKNLLYLGSDNTLYYPDGAMTIGSCRAHFRLEGIVAGDPAEQASLVRAFVLNLDDVVTSIQDAPFTIHNYSDAGADDWYDLQGRRLSGKPAQKGIYIHGGKAAVVKLLSVHEGCCLAI